MSSSRDEQLPDGPAELLTYARRQRAAADRADADLMRAAVQWAIQHPAESVEEAETLRFRGFGDSGVPVAGPGAPLVAEFSLAEFAAAVGMGPETGKRYVGQCVELAYRLPQTWARVIDGDLPGWKARQVAAETLWLSADAAEYVDTHVAPFAHKIRPAVLDRLVQAAVARFMPEQAEQDRRAAWDRTHATIDYGSVGIAGTCQVTAEVDLADAIDLDHALAADAKTQADLGSVQTLDQRRATALGNIARRDLTLTYPTQATQQPGRTIQLHVHLSQTAIEGNETIGRVENTRTPVSIKTIREWCGAAATTKIVVTPVVDLAEHVHIEAYEANTAISEVLALRDLTCVFPWCSRPARKLQPDEHKTDCDHNKPHAEGGPTCSSQMAPLCRRHHRLKTHGGWTYQILEPGSYLWTSPHDYHYLRDHTGTLDVTRDKHRRPPPAHPPQQEPDPPDQAVDPPAA
jgi:hypothetical protein